MNIGIYTTRKKWEEKRNHKEDSVYWTVRNFPMDEIFKDINNVYFAFDGYWQGYFRFDYGFTVLFGHPHFYRKTWVWLKKKTPRKQFQGFTYKTPN